MRPVNPRSIANNIGRDDPASDESAHPTVKSVGLDAL
jgi:hypothetical protein